MDISAQEAKELAVSLGFDGAGIALPHSAALPAWVRSVLICMHATLDDAFDYEMYIEYDGRRKWYKSVYTMLESLSMRVAESLRSEGVRAMPLTFDDSLALIDLRRSAVEAGLGVWGKNNLVVTRQYGSRVRFGAVFVDAEWPADSPILDYYCPSCTLCWAACPTDALGVDGYNRDECIAEYSPTPALAARQESLEIRPSACTRVQCTACITACPIGSNIPVAFYRNLKEETPAHGNANHRLAEHSEGRIGAKENSDMSETIRMYSTPWCGDCRRAKMIFKSEGISYTEIDISDDAEAIAYVEKINNGLRSVPTIVFPDGTVMVEPSSPDLVNKLRALRQG